MNLKFKPWILAGIIRHNHSLIDFQATERLIAVYAKRDRRNLAREGMIFERGRGIFDWFSSSRDYIVQSTIKAQKSNSFESPLEFICSLTFVRAGDIFSFLAASILSKIPCAVFVTFNVLALTCDNERSKNCRYKKEWNRWAPISFAN